MITRSLITKAGRRRIVVARSRASVADVVITTKNHLWVSVNHIAADKIAQFPRRCICRISASRKVTSSTTASTSSCLMMEICRES